MASGAATLPRPATSSGLPIRNLPVIQHPNHSRDSISGDFLVRGESRAGSCCFSLPGREQTFVSLDGGKLTLGLERRGLGLPPLREGSQYGRSGPNLLDLRSLNGQTEIGYKTTKGKYQLSIEEQPKYNHDDLEWMIQERLRSSHHGLKHLFKTNDPNGEGTVTKDALFKILHSVVGYVSRDQFNLLLKRIGLDKKDAVPYDTFVSCFENKETTQKAWMAPVQKMYMAESHEKYQHPEQHLRFTDLFFKEENISATFCFSVLRKKAQNKSFKIEDALPQACLEPDGRVLPAHLREFVKRAGISITDEEFEKLWLRYDRDGVGAVKTTRFKRLLGISTRDKSSNKQPEVKTNPPQQEKDAERKAIKDGEDTKKTEVSKQSENEPVKDQTCGTEKAQKKLKSSKFMLKKPAPRLEKAIDCLHYKFEEAYNSLLMGMQCFDFLGDGGISRIDFRHVLEAFGFKITSTDLEHFLSRCGTRTIRGEIAYKDFLMKFWNKSESGLLHRIVTSSFHVFKQDTLPDLDEMLSGEQLEAKLIDFLHGDFLKFIGQLKELDKYSIGVVTQYEFKYAVEKILGYQMSPSQWQELVTTVGLDADGLVPFPKFLLMFNIMPGAWNKKELRGHLVRQISQKEPSSVVDGLKTKSQKMYEERRKRIEAQDKKQKSNLQRPQTRAGQQQDASESRSTDELDRLLREFFRTKFYEFDQAFKTFDRRMTNRIYRHNFMELLRECSFPITREESERVWLGLNLADDGMMHFSALVSHFRGENADSLAEAPQDNVVTNEPGPSSETTHRPRFTVRDGEQDRDVRNTSRDGHAKDTPLCSRERDELLERIRPKVLDQWDYIRSQLKQKDIMGSATVLATQMKSLMRSLRLPISEEEVHTILQRFEVKHKARFNYIDFLKYFASDSNNNSPGKLSPPEFLLSYKLRQKQVTSNVWLIEHPTIAQVIERLRTKLLKDWKNLRRAFKKLDTSHSGYLSTEDFSRALSGCGIEVGGDDLFNILSQFDTNMDGRVSYEEFVAQLLNTA